MICKMIIVIIFYVLSRMIAIQNLEKKMKKLNPLIKLLKILKLKKMIFKLIN